MERAMRPEELMVSITGDGEQDHSIARSYTLSFVVEFVI